MGKPTLSQVMNEIIRDEWAEGNDLVDIDVLNDYNAYLTFEESDHRIP